MSEINTIKINDVEYIRKDSIAPIPASRVGLQYVICRTYSAGVFAGYLKSRIGQEVVLLEARRIYYWEGAATLSQLAVDGTSNPAACKFPVAVPRLELLQAIEILECTTKAQESIASVKIWEL